MAEETIPRQLGAILDVLGLEWESLFDQANPKEASQNRDRVMGWLYRILDTLDNKTGHLLRFAALLLTAQTLVAGILVRNKQTPVLISFVALILLVVPLVLAIKGLPVFKVEWKFFGKVRKDVAAARNEEQIKIEMKRLADLCDERADAHNSTLTWSRRCVNSFGFTLLLAMIVLLWKWGLSST
jgi:hypothetical protein